MPRVLRDVMMCSLSEDVIVNVWRSVSVYRQLKRTPTEAQTDYCIQAWLPGFHQISAQLPPKLAQNSPTCYVL